jgi:hypothetical protein
MVIFALKVLSFPIMRESGAPIIDSDKQEKSGQQGGASYNSPC